MSEFSDLNILFHAWALESKFYSTKLCSIVKNYSESLCTKEEMLRHLPLPSDEYWEKATEEISEAQKLGLSCISILDSAYPSRLTEIEDPPMLLFVMGGTYGIPFNIVEKCYAVVGTRKPTLYGESVAMSLGKRLSNLGITVVSGLAMGVDKRAHEGSLKGIANVPTIAVLGSGLLQIYPRINSNLAGDIVGKGGLIVSEFGLGQSPRAHFFPRRNRIISALSSSVVIVEAEEKSGSLITARLALEQNRDVYAVPGPIDSMLSRGTNKLIAQGASIIISVEDFGNEVIEREGFTQNKKLPLTSMIEIKYDLSDKEKEILNVVSSEALSFEEIMNITRLNYSELRLCITNLQLKDIISERDGIYFREEIG